LQNARIGLADNWIRHIQDVRDRYQDRLRAAEPHERLDILCELNVIEQVVNVCHSTVMQDAWARGRVVTVHGWIYGVHDGLLQDLLMSVSGPEQLHSLHDAAVVKLFDRKSNQGSASSLVSQ
jgi:carbonic anhydrase